MSRGDGGAVHVVSAAWPRDAHGELLIGGMPLERAVDSVGGTPCYLYDRAMLTERATRLRHALDPLVQLHYAIKANPMPAVVQHMANLVDGLDVASAGEMRIALDAGMKPSSISFAGPGKRVEELRQALAAGVVVNVESLREIRLLGELARATGLTPCVALRVNLAFELKTSGMKMSGGPRQFGIDAEQVSEALARIVAEGLHFDGFHLFAGSQNLRADAIIEAQAGSYACALAWSREAGLAPRVINLGGGFGIRYTEHDRTLDEAPVVAHLNQLSQCVRRDYDGATLAIELGRYLVGEAGLYVTRVLDRKLSRGRVFLVVDGGMHQHLAASGNFGQVLRKNYPVAVNGKHGDLETASVVGPLCTPLDLLADQALLPRAGEGDLVAVLQSGAYGRSASPAAFLGHPEVREALL
jgi:diaminopimelate decarboxylase